jgi:hypothetical protein
MKYVGWILLGLLTVFVLSVAFKLVGALLGVVVGLLEVAVPVAALCGLGYLVWRVLVKSR